MSERLAAGDAAAERVVQRNDAAPGGDPRVARRAVVEEDAAGARAQAVGRDRNSTVLDPAVREAHRDAAVVLIERGALGAEPDGVRSRVLSAARPEAGRDGR